MTAPFVLGIGGAELVANDSQGEKECAPVDSIAVGHFTQRNGVRQWENDGSWVYRSHQFNNFLCECVLNRGGEDSVHNSKSIAYWHRAEAHECGRLDIFDDVNQTGQRGSMIIRPSKDCEIESSEIYEKKI